jgi:hypothetical protein
MISSETLSVDFKVGELDGYTHVRDITVDDLKFSIGAEVV